MTAAEVVAAVRARHPTGTPGGMVGEWTVICEWKGIDVLAWSAWRSSGYRRVGYEVKVSRGDLRYELLHPHKRRPAVELCDEFYLAVPEGLLKPEELAYEEPIWDDGAWERKRCPARCHKVERYARERDRYLPRQGKVASDPVPVPAVLSEFKPWWREPEYGDSTSDYAQRQADRQGITVEMYVEREADQHLAAELRSRGWTHRRCPTCDGKGYVKGSRVDEEAPQLWVPADVGLVEVDGNGCRVRRKAPRTEARDLRQSELADLVRWCSFRGDARHR